MSDEPQSHLYKCSRPNCGKEGDELTDFVWGSKSIICVDCSDAEQEAIEAKRVEALRQAALAAQAKEKEKEDDSTKSVP